MTRTNRNLLATKQFLVLFRLDGDTTAYVVRARSEDDATEQAVCAMASDCEASEHDIREGFDIETLDYVFNIDAR